MIINYTFVHQFRPIKSVYFKENNSLATNEFKLFLSKKHNLNMSLYNIFYKKKKLNEDYIFFEDSVVIIYKKCNLSPNERRKLLLETRKML